MGPPITQKSKEALHFVHFWPIRFGRRLSNWKSRMDSRGTLEERYGRPKWIYFSIQTSDLSFNIQNASPQAASGICGLSTGQRHTLSLTSCKSNEFTCKTGRCVSLNKKCDGVVDCQGDGSDEIYCAPFDLASSNYTNSKLTSGATPNRPSKVIPHNCTKI